MADRSSLGFLGLIFGGVTVAVMLLAASVVFAHVGGNLVLDGASTVAVTAAR